MDNPNESSPESVNIHDSEQTGAAPKARIVKAVAIQYNDTTDQTPHITASGKGVIAEQILAIAFAQGIKVREDADLVEILSQLEIDTPIPVEAFAAVAEILAYVYKANASMKQRKAQTMHKESL